MGEIIFNKSRKNLKKIQNQINSKNLNIYIKAQKEEVQFLAVGGYNRTYQLLIELGASPKEILTTSNLVLTKTFLEESHGKKIVLIKKINYTTNVWKGLDFSKKRLDLNVADSFEESMMIYAEAERSIYIDRKRIDWQKPKIVVLDDPSLNLQFEGHRFNYQTKIGFVQMRNRNANPKDVVAELENVEEAEMMMFALYQETGVNEVDVLNALSKLREEVKRQVDENWYLKPTEFKKIVGSPALFNKMRDMPELAIKQLSSNKRLGNENSRWIVLPESAFSFTGFDYVDEEEMFEKELEQEQQAEDEFASEQDKQLFKILNIELPINVKVGFVGNNMATSKRGTLQNFIDEIDEVEAEVEGASLLDGATTEDEYKHIKKYNLAYFLDGDYKNSERLDENYTGGKRLISIDIDDGDYTREQIEDKLQQQNLFGLVYRTAKFYFDGANRWRIILMADEEMTKQDYNATVAGVAKMLDLEIDNASKKISQLMGYPLAAKDLSVVIGSFVSVKQFKKSEPTKKTLHKNVLVMDENRSVKSIADFNHAQARLLKDVLQNGVPEGHRNETYRQIKMYLTDTLNNPEMARYHKEAEELLQITKQQAISDGLPEKEVEVIYR